MCTHAVTFLIFWKIIYFEPLLMWDLPAFVNFREALLDPYVIFLGIIYIIVFSLILLYKFKLKNAEETTSNM